MRSQQVALGGIVFIVRQVQGWTMRVVLGVVLVLITLLTVGFVLTRGSRWPPLAA